MSHHDHRPGVSQASLVTRRLRVKPDTAGHISAAVSEIDALLGLDSVSYDSDNRKLHLAYDANRLCIDDIEEVLARHGIDIGPGRWNRIKEDYYRFVDQNVKDNAKQKPWSCH